MLPFRLASGRFYAHRSPLEGTPSSELLLYIFRSVRVAFGYRKNFLWVSTLIMGRLRRSEFGRNRTPISPAAMQHSSPLSDTVGSVLDPIVSLRRACLNVSDRPRRLSVTSYWEWVLGDQRQKTLLHSPATMSQLSETPPFSMRRSPFWKVGLSEWKRNLTMICRAAPRSQARCTNIACARSNMG